MQNSLLSLVINSSILKVKQLESAPAGIMIVNDLNSDQVLTEKLSNLE
ncbi:hypothetical protein XCR1_70009 [Xenorhabdus cabanillasii JM26]|uniref:Uncharacterized protein n=1 Tax=Xenorhabdus cabanillasii JM26 TaxID=1427517 RepID=W1J7S5_9GAMM|nr:hypothetical protein XCR1_70009 [Xenorhabdus cabanillasii JM26]